MRSSFGTDGRGLWYNRQVMVDAGVIASKDEEWVPEPGMTCWMRLVQL